MGETIKKHAFKIQVGTAIFVMFTAMVMTFNATSIFKDVESSVENLKKETANVVIKQNDFEDRVDDIEKNYIRIETKLDVINETLKAFKK